MTPRHRGAHHDRETWQPRAPARVTPKTAASTTKSTLLPTGAADVEHIAQKAATDTVAEFAAAAATHMTSARSTQRRRYRALTTLLMLAVAIGLFAVSTGQHVAGAGRDTAGLPATPREWVDAYEAAAIDNPSRVCTQLLSPQLAVTYAAAVHGSCTTYFARIRSTSLSLRRVLQDGSTAVVELRQTIEKTDWTVVLDQRGTGWQAVDLVPRTPAALTIHLQARRFVHEICRQGLANGAAAANAERVILLGGSTRAFAGSPISSERGAMSAGEALCATGRS